MLDVASPFRPQEKSADERRIRALERTIGQLREEVRQLQNVLHPEAHVPAQWKLTRYEARLFRTVLARELATYDQMALALRKDDEALPSSGSVQVCLCRLRKKVARFGVIILTARGEGARLEARLSWKAKLG